MSSCSEAVGGATGSSLKNFISDRRREEGEFLTAREAAHRIGVSHAAVLKAVSAGKLPTSAGLIARGRLDAWSSGRAARQKSPALLSELAEDDVPSDDTIVDPQAFSMRAGKAVNRLGCVTVGDIRGAGRQAFRDLPNCGKRTLDEIFNRIGQSPPARHSETPRRTHGENYETIHIIRKRGRWTIWPRYGTKRSGPVLGIVADTQHSAEQQALQKLRSMGRIHEARNFEALMTNITYEVVNLLPKGNDL